MSNDLNTDLTTPEQTGEGFGFEVLLAAFADFSDKQAKAIAATKDVSPILTTHWGSAIAAAGVNPTLVQLQDITSPAAGRCWCVSTAGIYGVADAHTQINGTPITPAVNAIPLAASGVASYNNNSTGVNLTISGGTVTAIAINGTTTGLTSGTFFVPAGGTVTVTYTVAPTTFTTAGLPVTNPVIAEFYAGDSPDAAGIAGQPLGTPFPDNFGPGGNPGITVPNAFTLSRRVIWVNHTETIYALVYGALTGQQFVLVANIEDYPVDAMQGVSA